MWGERDGEEIGRKGWGEGRNGQGRVRSDGEEGMGRRRGGQGRARE